MLRGGNGGGIRGDLGAADVARFVAAVDSAAFGDGPHRVEQHHALQACVGHEDVLVGGALDLEAPGREADGGDVDEVVAFPAGKGDGEAAALVGAGGTVHSASHGRCGDVGVFDWRVVGPCDHATNDVDLLGCGLAGHHDDGEHCDHYYK